MMNWRTLSIALLPGLCVALFYLGRVAFSMLTVGNCGADPACSAQVSFVAMISLTFLAVSALGCGVTAYLMRATLSQLPAPTVLAAVALSAVFLLLLFLSVPYWSYSGLALLVTLTLLCAAASWAAILGAKRLTAT
ncbi:MAG: hypothetical protein EPO06_05005 [Burkholderiaceae bacterium]|nr:MAG: hypothetical protein EPO06_05005 [Burkholderiaceae bacterium]